MPKRQHALFTLALAGVASTFSVPNGRALADDRATGNNFARGR